MKLHFLKPLLAVSAVLMMGQSLAETKVIRAGTEPTYAPFEFLDENTNSIGYDIDIINEIAKKAGYEVEIVRCPFDGLIPALMTSQIDVAISGITITSERKKKLDFSTPYYHSGLTAVILKENADKYAKIDDLKDKKICGQIGTTGLMYAEKISKESKAFNTNPEAYMELKSRGCEAVITDKPVNDFFLSKAPKDHFVALDDVVEAEDFGIAVRKGNDEMLKIINDGLAELEKSGKLKELYKKWFFE
ncbi:MAG: basic amino acid ABC transporter substrate-binding protein [Succinivibrio sp.]|nr:basic amino acid ABC transporter substrate-binding protein [Succinivibrio sp.]